jgi:hypothetical protein
MPDLSRRAVEELAVRLTGLQGRDRSVARREFSALHCCSPSTLSRQLHAIGFRSHQRCDRGIRRTGHTDEQLAHIAALQASSLSLRKGIVMPANVAIEIAEHNGIAPGLSASSYNAWLRAQSGSRRDQTAATPHIELRSLGPNHVHQVDFSLAVNWKVKNNKPIYEHLIYKNKLPKEGEPRIWRLLVIDHATGCFFPHYTVSAGETVQGLLEGLFYAWSEKKLNGESLTRQYPFRGVPQILMADRGSTTKSGVTVALLNRLGVTLNICEGARSKGTVEVSHRIWEEHFETRLRLQPPDSIEQLNEWAIKYAAHYCATERHTRTGSERSTLWAWHIGRRPETQLRELRCSFETFKSIALTDAQKCKVGGSRIVRFRSQKYRVPDCFLPNTFVDVQFSPFEFPQIQVRPVDQPTAAAYLCTPVEVDEFGFATTAATIGQEYKGVKATPAATFARDAQRNAKVHIDGGKVEAFGYHLERTPEIGVPTQGTELPVEAQAEAVMTRVSARTQVIEMLGRALTSPEAAHVNRVFGERVTEADITAAVAEIQRGIGARVLEFASGQK